MSGRILCGNCYGWDAESLPATCPKCGHLLLVEALRKITFRDESECNLLWLLQRKMLQEIDAEIFDK